jgi:hypothetical protein
MQSAMLTNLQIIVPFHRVDAKQHTLWIQAGVCTLLLVTGSSVSVYLHRKYTRMHRSRGSYDRYNLESTSIKTKLK